MRFTGMKLTIGHFVVFAFMLFAIFPVVLYAHSHYRTLRLPMQLLQPQDFFLPFGMIYFFLRVLAFFIGFPYFFPYPCILVLFLYV